MKYELEWLSVEFEKHGNEAMVSNEEMKKRFKMMNPDAPLPEHLDNDFMLPTALKSMVDEVISLRQQVGELVDYIHGEG